MSDSKDNLEENLVEFDDLVGEGAGDSAEDLFGTHEDLPDDPDELILGESGGTEIGVADNIKTERMWIIVTVVAFALALLASSVLNPMIASQLQRVNQAEQVSNFIDLTNTSAAQALTPAGEFAPVAQSLADTESAVNSLLNPSGTLPRLSNKLFVSNAEATSVAQHWQNYKQATGEFLGNESQVTDVKQSLTQLNLALTQAVSESVSFVDAVAKEGRNKNTGKSKDKYLFLTSEAANLNGILSRLGTSVRGHFIPGQDLAQLADSQNGLMVRLKDTLNRIINNAAAVVGTTAEPLQSKYEDLGARVLDIGSRATALTASRAALGRMRSESGNLNNALAVSGTPSNIVAGLSLIRNILPIFFALLGGYALWRYFTLQSSDLVAQEANLSETLADQQESILKLLDEMSALADGDLTVEAEVTDQITGAIADSVNFAVIEMRELVSQITRASIEVANESELAVNNAQSVSQSNMNQATQITAAAKLMEQVSQSMHEMSGQASSSSEMAAESMRAAEQGTRAVRDTISGMEDMREQIQDTSKRIKRLGESSQRIGDIVALIDDIAEQTNILSLNAAIQASMAGEAGRGFAVVSDEVQSLAERSTEATKKIAELVATIQTDTNDAVLSMEKATQQVVSGTQVADSAGSALSAIELVSKRLSNLIQGIAEGSTKQAEVATKVSEQVSLVSQSSAETSHKAQASANSIAKLLELAKDLETSVSRFKLPAA